MKKIGIVFLALTGIAVIALTAVSCNSAVKEEFGTVVLDFGGGGTRAVGADGLPLLNDSRILIKGAGSLSGPFSKEFSSAQGVSLSFPIGDEVTLRVSILTPSARWSSAPQSFTVEAGTNALSVKLSKKISGLNNLLFTQTKSGTSAHVYDLTLHMDGKPINNVPESTRSEHIFSRDSKGRLYVGYKANEPGDPQKLVRYTSEGELDGHPAQSAVDFLANDYTTGKMYGASVRHLMEIKEDLSLARVTSGYDTGLFAVDNGRVIYGSWGQKTLTLSKIGSTAKNEIRSDKIAPYARHFGIATGKWMIKDLFIRGNYLYILFSSVEESDSDDDDAEPTLGAVLKWKLGTRSDGLPDIVGDPILIGKPAGSLPIENQVLPSSYYAKNFYGAVKVIGFDDENLYIADDGFDAAMTDAGPKIMANRNRIAILNMQTNELTFTDAGPAKWYNEWKEWKAPNTKTIVWNKTHDGNGSFEKTTFKQQGSSDRLFETASNKDGLFAFDQSGILYIPYKDVSNNKIKRFIQDDDGAYEEGEEFEFSSSSDLPGAMAVDTSRSHKLTAQKAGSSPEEKYYNVLYCSDDNNNINRFVWTDDFTAAFKDTLYIIQGTEWTVTALAANKDGLFVALWKREFDTDKYDIKINRYDKVSGAFSGTVVLVSGEPSEIPGDSFIHEKITDMHIQDGNLYVLTLKEMREDNSTTDKRLFTSGKLWYISSTADFGDNKRVLYESREKTSEPDTLEKNFAPLRFIAVKPKKLVIASDGYYGEKYDWHCIKNFDKVFAFDIGSWNSPVGEPVENTTFTKVLTVSAEYEFLP
ncbi:hypothetical protein V1L52_03240 [Treponema sp. HNW]|uniref:hypothetical protein n=1 Tax=Treponema sp. HNW TaxID=3116654 RepID=UPI003D12D72B